jgi:2-polyprenyl-3-methyl-5-hydroxy-6-metoxy-1,4-benzoquinol methylase
MAGSVIPIARTSTVERARQSLGSSAEAIYRMVAGVLSTRRIRAELLLDVGCGTGNLRPFVQSLCGRYAGVDVLRYDDFPNDCEFVALDLDSGRMPLPDATADVVSAVETIEHLENPRAFVRELVRVAKPGGLVIVTTPNQLTLLSMVTLIYKRQYSAFQSTDYPAHITALLEIDLARIARECGLDQVQFEYSRQGRVPFTAAHYPAWISNLFPRRCSDNLALIGRKVKC